MTQFDLLHEFVKTCDQAFEEMKHDEGLVMIAARTLEGRLNDCEYIRDFYSTIDKKITDCFKKYIELSNFYNNHRDVCVEKFRDYSFRFLKYIEDTK